MLIPFESIIQRSNFKSRAERASCAVSICLGVLLLSILVLEVGSTQPLVSLPDNIVALI